MAAVDFGCAFIAAILNKRSRLGGMTCRIRLRFCCLTASAVKQNKLLDGLYDYLGHSICCIGAVGESDLKKTGTALFTQDGWCEAAGLSGLPPAAAYFARLWFQQSAERTDRD